MTPFYGVQLGIKGGANAMEMGREEFLNGLKQRFPEVLDQINTYQNGLLHCEVAVFRQATEYAMDAGEMWKAEQHFRFVSEMLAQAGPELKNALEVSYLGDLARGVHTPGRYQAIKQRMPTLLRSLLIRHDDRWR
jgi:hypothetical protein